jgi:S-adenosylmethionine hydrolase
VDIGRIRISNSVQGKVESLSPTGDLITDISVAQCGDAPDLLEVRVQIGPHETIGIHDPDHGEPESTLIAVRNAGDFVEIGITGMNISEMLGIKVGDEVTVRW